MNFISLIYFFFMGLTLYLYWRSNSQQQRLWVMVIASLLFYTLFYKGQTPLLIIFNLALLGIIIYVNFWLGKLLLESQIIEYRIIQDNLLDYQQSRFLPRTKAQRQRILLVGIVFNVLLLLAAKYIPFFLMTLSGLGMPQLQSTANWYRSSILPPLGISFLTFESISYLVDVYKGSPATGNLLKYAAYKSFFPKLISGPISHYHEFAPQLNSLKMPQVEVWLEGLWLIACGAVKKTLIADNLASYVNLVFGDDMLNRSGSVDLWLAILAYGWQLYFDFSGYVDIARGSSLFFGIELPENFNFPYCSTNIADFWRRWHITLGDWLRQYIYFPLGGSLKGIQRTCLNLLAIMLIAGIWHGPDWGFLLWGGIHGLALVAHRLMVYYSEQRPDWKKFWESSKGLVVGWLLTQPFVFLAWVFFRLPKPDRSGWVLTHLWGQTADSQFSTKLVSAGISLDNSQIFVCLLSLALLTGAVYYGRRVMKVELGWKLKLLLLPVAFYLVWLLVPAQSSPYIYFDF